MMCKLRACLEHGRFYGPRQREVVSKHGPEASRGESGRTLNVSKVKAKAPREDGIRSEGGELAADF